MNLSFRIKKCQVTSDIKRLLVVLEMNSSAHMSAYFMNYRIQLNREWQNMSSDFQIVNSQLWNFKELMYWTVNKIDMIRKLVTRHTIANQGMSKLWFVENYLSTSYTSKIIFFSRTSRAKILLWSWNNWTIISRYLIFNWELCSNLVYS